MEVLQVTQPGEVRIAEKDMRSLQSGEVLVDMKRVGICGSDILIYTGGNPFTVYPRVIGHEMAGVVSQVGSDVTNVAVGDRVSIDPVLNCGECDGCPYRWWFRFPTYSSICKCLSCSRFPQLGGRCNGGTLLNRLQYLPENPSRPRRQSLDRG